MTDKQFEKPSVLIDADVRYSGSTESMTDKPELYYAHTERLVECAQSLVKVPITACEERIGPIPSVALIRLTDHEASRAADKARIAELERERDEWHRLFDSAGQVAKNACDDRDSHQRVCMRVIQERDELVEALRHFIDADSQPSGISGKYGNALTQAVDKLKQEHDQRIAFAVAALAKSGSGEES